jgi:hypothetical protein
MSVEPPINGPTFGGPVPTGPAPARFAAHDQLADPVGATGFSTAEVPHSAIRPSPSFRHEPAVFGPAPAGFPRRQDLGYPGSRPFFAGAQPIFGEVTGRPNTLAILALVFAFCSPLAGLVLGLIAKRQIAESGEQGDGMALAGIIVGAFLTVVAAVWLIFGIVSWVQLGQAMASAPEEAAIVFPN